MSHHYSGPHFGFPRGDARLDVCDLFAFPKPGEAGKSILIMDVHPSVGINPPGPTPTEPFAPEAPHGTRSDQVVCSASRRIEMACATAARVACVPLSGLSIMKSCVMPS